MTGAPVDYNAELSRYGAALRRAWAVRPDDGVRLDSRAWIVTARHP